MGGPWRTCFVHFASGLGGNLLSVTFMKEGSVTVGASGALFGLIAALPILFAEFGQRAARAPRAATIAVVITLMIAIVGGAALPALVKDLPLVDSYTHLGGAWAGFWSAVLVRGLPSRHKREGRGRDDDADEEEGGADKDNPAKKTSRMAVCCVVVGKLIAIVMLLGFFALHLVFYILKLVAGAGVGDD